MCMVNAPTKLFRTQSRRFALGWSHLLRLRISRTHCTLTSHLDGYRGFSFPTQCPLPTRTISLMRWCENCYDRGSNHLTVSLISVHATRTAILFTTARATTFLTHTFVLQSALDSRTAAFSAITLTAVMVWGLTRSFKPATLTAR
jgi:hypothetical protein